MLEYKCKCGRSTIIFNYTIKLEGSLTFRIYRGICDLCDMQIDITDINESDLIAQEYLF